MPPAARVGDPTGHPGTITGPGVQTVLVGGTPAAVVGDLHTCAFPPPAGPHPPSPITKGSTTVMIGGRPAARMGDLTGCGAPIVGGAPTVMVGG
ncbi:MAG TPA: PAAR domain-containing protein [Actinomycetota bacterium]|nr:PAAR domain-containing protein [Actinomycetota bacterium]